MAKGVKAKKGNTIKTKVSNKKKTVVVKASSEKAKKGAKESKTSSKISKKNTPKSSPDQECKWGDCHQEFKSFCESFF